MSRGSLLNSPLLLGFDQFERTLEQIAKASSDGYPPYNIERVDNERLRITLAVAGFAPETLDISHAGNQLTVTGDNGGDGDDDPARVYLHRGIAARKFRRSFVLAEGLEVAGATLDNGLLHIDVVRPQPQDTVRKIEITTSGPRNGATKKPQRIDID